MTEDRLPSKFAFILHADVAGSTELVRRNEHVAHKRIQETFRRFSDIISTYHGHVRELRGDALLAEFERASGAASAALAFQAEHKDYLSSLDDPIRPRVRVGIAMGEVIIADDTITGAGVVLAQRLEQLSEPGGVVIQGAVYETIPRRLPFSYDNLGNQELKGFEELIRAYSVSLDAGNSIPPAEESISPIEKLTLALPNKPSIAVLPFDNMSSDPEQGYFSDGITEDIITTLSKVPDLFVIARNSAFTYKGTAIDVKQVAQDLGVRYVVEGSVRKAGQRVRVTAQLIDALTGHHLWADRYDRDLSDIFALQDEITREIVTAVDVELTEGDQIRAWRDGAGDMAAYEYFAKGRDYFSRITPKAISQAQQEFERLCR